MIPKDILEVKVSNIKNKDTNGFNFFATIGHPSGGIHNFSNPMIKEQVSSVLKSLRTAMIIDLEP